MVSSISKYKIYKFLPIWCDIPNHAKIFYAVLFRKRVSLSSKQYLMKYFVEITVPYYHIIRITDSGMEGLEIFIAASRD
jgi:hypothetical protein